MKKAVTGGVALLAGVLFSTPVMGERVASAINSGGSSCSSADYENYGSLGGSGGISSAGSAAVVARHGFIGQLTEASSLALNVAPPSVNEGATSQLSGSATLDDDTVTLLAGTDVIWSVVSGPISSIDASGLATTDIVYANQLAAARGFYLGASNSVTLTVLDSDLDNYGSYADDGINDAWQVQYFGLPPNPDAAPSADPDGDGFVNLLEFQTGTVPTNSASYPAPPVIISGPTITNALSRVGNVCVVAVAETNVFAVGATNGVLSYQWTFGDGAVSDWSSSSNGSHAYVTDCGPYSASVAVSNNVATISSNFTVAIACSMNITKMGAKLNFAKLNSDSCSLTATLNLGAGFNLTNKVLTVDVGGAQVPFTLDPKGKGRGVSPFGSCKMAYNKKAGLWTLTVKLAKGTWRTPWGAHDLVNGNVLKPGVLVTMPVVVVIGVDAFADEHSMFYTAKKNKSGSAK